MGYAISALKFGPTICEDIQYVADLFALETTIFNQTIIIVSTNNCANFVN